RNDGCRWWHGLDGRRAVGELVAVTREVGQFGEDDGLRHDASPPWSSVTLDRANGSGSWPLLATGGWGRNSTIEPPVRGGVVRSRSSAMLRTGSPMVSAI